MSTPHDPPRDPDRTNTRFEVALGAIGALIAVGAIALIVALTSGHRTTTGNAAAHRPTVAATSAAPAGYLPDPASHAIPAAAIPDAIANPQPERSSAPTQASVLRSLTPAQRRYVLGILALSPAQLRAAFGTDT